MKSFLALFCTILMAGNAMSQNDTVTGPDTLNSRIVLLGDAGEIRGNGQPVIDWMKAHIDWNDYRNSIIFLGDNVYPLGLPLEGDPGYPLAKKILDYEISLTKGKKARAFFIPGNHDWRNGKLGGWEQAVNQEDYINSQEQKNIQAWPINGCPGPIPIELSDKVVLALVDSQWFLYLHDKPGPGSSCSAKTVDEFQSELQEIANSHPNQLMIIATHHPPYSYGVHGGDYTLKEHIFPFTSINKNLYIPLPILGSIYPLTRGVFGNVQDVKHPLYKTMAVILEDVAKSHSNSIIVSGHDHSLQMMMKDSLPYIVSGAGVNSTRAKEGKFKLFSDVSLGFSMIEVWKSGKVEVKFYNIQSKDLTTPTFTTQLKSIPPIVTPTTFDTTRPIFDSVMVIAANPKLKGNGFKKFLVGENYRKEWTQPVRVKVLDLTKDMGGLRPTKQGGGKQTRSLRVVDSTGKEWAIRSIVKYPEAAIPADLRKTFAKDIVADGISASYPYGALSMETLSRAAGVPYLRNRLIYLPDDPRLERFRGDFKNMLALIEEREPPGVKKTDNTDEVVLKLAKDNDDHIDQKAVLKARLLDNFVMDLDRHEGQWDWATKDTGKGKLYYPIPKDRDQVFLTNQGLIPYFIRKPWLVPELQGFRAKAINIKTFNRAARNFDRTFLTQLTADDWKLQVDSFLTAMTDNVIETALRRQPPEIEPYHAEKIIKKLKKRRKHFAKEMREYYRFLSKNVTIPGSNQREFFNVAKNEDGSMRVVVSKISKDGTIGGKMYDRLFDPEVTKEVILYGLNEADSFVVSGPNSKIKVRMVGGSGNDIFVNNGSGKKVLVYDASFEKNKFEGTETFRKTVIPDPQVNRYDRLNFKYGYFNPGIGFEYNVDDGVFVGVEGQYVKQGFRKEPYSIKQNFSARRALKTGSLHFTYNADFIKAFRNSDIIVRSDFRAPVNVTNFFGEGNDTRFIKTPGDDNDIQFYRTRYNISNITVSMRRQLQSWMRFTIGPSFQSFNLDSSQNVGKYVSMDPNLDPKTIYRHRAFLGADFGLDINSKNNPVIPTRGFVLDAGIRPLFGLNETSSNILQAHADMRIYMSLYTQKRLVLALRFGWGANYGNYEFPQAMYLGQTENLRGFRKQRFAGKSMLFNNSELRIKLFDFNTYLFPGSFGLQVFNDIGRVWVRNDNSNTLHDGYGVGFWIAPIQRAVVTFSAARSKEETVIPRITFGFEF